jgi:hypothetical protein
MRATGAHHTTPETDWYWQVTTTCVHHEVAAVTSHPNHPDTSMGTLTVAHGCAVSTCTAFANQCGDPHEDLLPMAPNRSPVEGWSGSHFIDEPFGLQKETVLISTAPVGIASLADLRDSF